MSEEDKSHRYLAGLRPHTATIMDVELRRSVDYSMEKAQQLAAIYSSYNIYNNKHKNNNNSSNERRRNYQQRDDQQNHNPGNNDYYNNRQRTVICNCEFKLEDKR